MKILLLGAGFGGLELTTRLSEAFGDDAEIILIDKADGFVIGFSKLDVMFGRADAAAVTHPYRDIVKPGVRFVQATITSIDPEQRRVETDVGAFEGDVMVVALGADLDPEATPGLVEGGHDFYTSSGAFALREVLAEFEGGHVIVAVTSTPFKCPPAPSETVLLLHDFLSQRGLRDRSEISLLMPFATPIPPVPAASEAFLEAFAARGIVWHPDAHVRSLDPARKVVQLADGWEITYDLFLAVPVHRAPEVVRASSLCVDGWIPVDPRTLETSFDGVYAVGDVTSVGTPKAGVFAEGQASVVAESIIAGQQATGSPAGYGGYGRCFVEFGEDGVAGVDVTALPGAAPVGTFESPTIELRNLKSEFGSTRIQRWFDRQWTELPPATSG